MTQNTSIQQWPLQVNGNCETGLSPVDRGLAYGDGLFETMLFDRGSIPLFGQHLERLRDGCLRLKIPFLADSIACQWQSYLQQLERCGADRGIVKLTYTRGEGGQGYVPPDFATTSPTLIFSYTPLQRTDFAKAMRLAVLETRLCCNPLLAGLKHLNRLEYVLAGAELSALDADSGVLLDDRGFIVEALHHNLFVVKSSVLFTPSLTMAGVKGVMRRVIVEQLADDCRLPVVVSDDMTLATLCDVDEMFLCNSVRGIVPVLSCGPYSWSNWPVTDRLRTRLSAHWSAYAG